MYGVRYLSEWHRQIDSWISSLLRGLGKSDGMEEEVERREKGKEALLVVGM